MTVIDLPNPFSEPAPVLSADRPAVAPSHLDQVEGAAVGISQPEVLAATAPGMAHPLDIPEFLKRRT